MLRFIKEEEAPLCCYQFNTQIWLKIEDLLLFILLDTGSLFYFIYSLYFKNLDLLLPLNTNVFTRKSIASIRNLPHFLE